MLKNLTGNNTYLKKLNQALVLDLIRVHKKISRTSIAKCTGLSATAIGLITSELIRKKLIIETGAAKSTGGRKQILLELKNNSRYSIGVDFDINGIKFILIDMSSNILFEKTIPFPRKISINKLLEEISLIVKKILKDFSISQSKLMGIGFSIPGLMDIYNKHVIIAPNLKWKDIDIAAIWKTKSKIPLHLINEARSSAICEHWAGSCQQANNFICINIKSGIGSGIFLDGKLYHGHNNYAGEIGHIVVDDKGPLCGCGNHGCLETFSSVKSIVDAAKKNMPNKKKSKLKNIKNLSLDIIVKAATIDNDNYSKKILLDSAHYLAIAICRIVNTLNPEIIVIGKEFVKYSDLVIKHIKNTVNKKSLRYSTKNLKIITSTLGENSSALGAAIIPLQSLFGKSSV